MSKFIAEILLKTSNISCNIFTTTYHTIVKVLSQTYKKTLQRGAYLSDDLLPDVINLGLDYGVMKTQDVNTDKEPMATYTRPQLMIG